MAPPLPAVTPRPERIGAWGIDAPGKCPCESVTGMGKPLSWMEAWSSGGACCLMGLADSNFCFIAFSTAVRSGDV